MKPIATFVWVFAIALLASAAGPPGRGPLGSVFAAQSGPGVYVINADGSGRTNLTADLAEVAFPVWSPSDDRIAFLSAGTLHVVNADGSGLRQLADIAAEAVPPSWSPDGRQILLLAADGGIYAVGVDGSGAVELAGGGDVGRLAHYVPGVRRPSWSPDGRRIAFVAKPPDEEGTEIYLMGADGSAPTRLTDLAPDEEDAMAPLWSPDGARVAFAATGGGGLYVVGADGSEPRKLFVGDAFDVAWSPDGSALAFGNYLGDLVTEIAILQVDGQAEAASTAQDDPSPEVGSLPGGPAVRPLTDQGDFGSPAWSPDGTTIAYRCGDAVCLMKADGTGQERLTDGAFPTWSPDGGRIVFWVLGGSGKPTGD